MNLREKVDHLDRDDPLRSFKDKFCHTGDEIYLDGNSLGKQPLQTKQIINSILNEQWGEKLVRSWNDSWLELPKRISAKIGSLLNARPNEIFIGESTSVNLYKLAYSLVTSGNFPRRLLTDSMNFPTDNYILEGIVKQLNLESLVFISYKTDLEAELTTLKEAIEKKPGVICLSLVSYKSAYYYPMKELNFFAKTHNSVIIWDLSHAVGAVDVDFKKTNTFAAVGCTYKYLNGGPGSPSFMYIDQSLIPLLSSPIQGWFGHINPFDFESKYSPSLGIEKFAAGTPQILSLAAVEAGLDITLEAGLKQIRQKSEKLGTFLMQFIRDELVPLGFKIESPENPERRGSHITISHNESWRICQCLQNPNNGQPKIIPDFRPNRFIRLGFASLYTTYNDLLKTIERLKEIVMDREFLLHDRSRPKVT